MLLYMDLLKKPRKPIILMRILIGQMIRRFSGYGVNHIGKSVHLYNRPPG